MPLGDSAVLLWPLKSGLSLPAALAAGNLLRNSAIMAVLDLAVRMVNRTDFSSRSTGLNLWQTAPTQSRTTGLTL